MSVHQITPRSEAVQVRILGPVAVMFNDVPVPLVGQRQLRVLSALALARGRVLPVEQLIGDLWGERPPRTAVGQLQTSVWMIRRALSSVHAPQAVVQSVSSGYQLDTAHCELDSDRFRTVVAAAKEHHRHGRLEEAVDQFKRALSLWRGPALSTISSTHLQSRAARLEEERIAALEQQISLEITLGRYAEAIGELIDLAAQYPLREELHAYLMLALYHSGRQADALAVFRRARHILADELGIDPGPKLISLEQAILRQDYELLTA